MPFGHYLAGEMRCKYYHDPWQDYPHLFYVRWWPAPEDTTPVKAQFTRDIRGIREWLSLNVPGPLGWCPNTDGLRTRGFFLREDHAATAFRLRWC